MQGGNNARNMLRMLRVTKWGLLRLQLHENRLNPIITDIKSRGWIGRVVPIHHSPGAMPVKKSRNKQSKEKCNGCGKLKVIYNKGDHICRDCWDRKKGGTVVSPAPSSSIVEHPTRENPKISHILPDSARNSQSDSHILPDSARNSQSDSKVAGEAPRLGANLAELERRQLLGSTPTPPAAEKQEINKEKGTLKKLGKWAYLVVGAIIIVIFLFVFYGHMKSTSIAEKAIKREEEERKKKMETKTVYDSATGDVITT